jgi:hypothetical protein
MMVNFEGREYQGISNVLNAYIAVDACTREQANTLARIDQRCQVVRSLWWMSRVGEQDGIEGKVIYLQRVDNHNRVKATIGVMPDGTIAMTLGADALDAEIAHFIDEVAEHTH